MSTTPGRNDPCPCGSGKKYKRCCYGEGRLATTPTSKVAMIVVGSVLLLGLVFVIISLVTSGGSACPPGQVFDPAHGHCH